MFSELEQEEDLGPDLARIRHDSAALQPSSQIAHAGTARKASLVKDCKAKLLSVID